MKENELAKTIAEAYQKAESRWQAWRKLHPDDMRNGLDYSGSPEEDSIAASWHTLQLLLNQWKATHPAPSGYFWGVNPSHGPMLMKSAF